MWDDINEYMLPRWGFVPPITYALARPYEPLDLQESPYWYSRVLWSFYLSETLGDSIIQEIWYDMEDNGAAEDEIHSMTQVLADHGLDFEDAFEEYCVWNWFTGDRDDGNHYEEGGDPGWPEATPQAVYSAFPVVGGCPPDTCKPDQLACNYIHLDCSSFGGDAFFIEYDGPLGFIAPSAAHVTYLDDGLNAFYYGEIPVDPSSGNGSIIVEGVHDMSTVCLIVINKSQLADNMNYSFNADIWTGVPEETGFALSPAAPNPLAVSTEIAFSVPFGADQVELSIFDTTRRLVATLVDGEVTPGAGVARWDGTDSSGERVASGIYFARLVADEHRAVRKIALLR
jgi:hypothetical protein